MKSRTNTVGQGRTETQQMVVDERRTLNAFQRANYARLFRSAWRRERNGNRQRALTGLTVAARTVVLKGAECGARARARG